MARHLPRLIAKSLYAYRLDVFGLKLVRYAHQAVQGRPEIPPDFVIRRSGSSLPFAFALQAHPFGLRFAQAMTLRPGIFSKISSFLQSLIRLGQLVIVL